MLSFTFYAIFCLLNVVLVARMVFKGAQSSRGLSSIVQNKLQF